MASDQCMSILRCSKLAPIFATRSRPAGPEFGPIGDSCKQASSQQWVCSSWPRSSSTSASTTQPAATTRVACSSSQRQPYWPSSALARLSRSGFTGCEAIAAWRRLNAPRFAAAMTAPRDADSLLVERIRRGENDAWDDLIARYEGRLLAFVESRLGRRGPSEDIVQESFVSFLNSLPNYDGRRPLESYLFSICAYKLTDHLRREGRRPAVPLSSASDSSGDWQVSDSARRASSIARSGERKSLEEKAIIDAL